MFTLEVYKSLQVSTGSENYIMKWVFLPGSAANFLELEETELSMPLSTK